MVEAGQGWERRGEKGAVVEGGRGEGLGIGPQGRDEVGVRVAQVGAVAVQQGPFNSGGGEGEGWPEVVSGCVSGGGTAGAGRRELEGEEEEGGGEGKGACEMKPGRPDGCWENGNG